MLFFRACPRCRGAVHEDADLWAKWLLACVACGHVLTPKQEAALRGRPLPERGEQTRMVVRGNRLVAGGL